MISVIMAAYNAEKTIGQALQSVLNQTYRDFEVVVVDDCSTDKTAEVVGQYKDPRLRLIRLPKNSGVARARHEGFVSAKARWIAILDSDDIWQQDKLERQVKLIQATGAQLVFTGARFITNDGTPLGWVQHAPRYVDYRKLLRHNVIPNSSTLVRKDLLLKHEVLDDRVHEDYACWLSMLKQGHVAYGIDRPMLTYRLSTNARTANKLKSMVMNWHTLRTVGLSLPATLYYMTWYGINGIIKTLKLRS